MAEYCIKIDEKEIRFKDDIKEDSYPSSFDVVMDLIPVYYAFKCYNKGTRERSCKINEDELDQISSLTFLLSTLYHRLKTDVQKLVNLEILDSLKIYAEWVRNFQVEPDQSLDGQETLNDILGEIRYEWLKGLIKEEFNNYQSRLEQDSRNAKRKFTYWMKEKLVLEILRREDLLFFWSTLNKLKENKNTFNRTKMSRFIFFSTDIHASIKDSIALVESYLVHEVKKVSGADAMARWRDELNDLKNCWPGIGKYREKENGCYAIMTNESDVVYYALSGVREREDSLNELCEELRKIGVPSENAERCRVVDGMVFFGIEKDNEGKIFYKPIQYKDKGNIHEKNYACCERKILAHPNLSNNNSFFIRWAPCEKCCPALINRYKKIYAYDFSTKDSLSRNQTPSKLKEYDIDLNGKFKCIESKH